MCSIEFQYQLQAGIFLGINTAVRSKSIFCGNNSIWIDSNLITKYERIKTLLFWKLYL